MIGISLALDFFMKNLPLIAMKLKEQALPIELVCKDRILNYTQSFVKLIVISMITFNAQFFTLRGLHETSSLSAQKLVRISLEE